MVKHTPVTLQFPHKYTSNCVLRVCLETDYLNFGELLDLIVGFPSLPFAHPTLLLFLVLSLFRVSPDSRLVREFYGKDDYYGVYKVI